jgi:hypothetical protein
MLAASTFENRLLAFSTSLSFHIQLGSVSGEQLTVAELRDLDRTLSEAVCLPMLPPTSRVSEFQQART